MNRLVRPLSHFVQRTPMAPQYIEGSVRAQKLCRLVPSENR